MKLFFIYLNLRKFSGNNKIQISYIYKNIYKTFQLLDIIEIYKEKTL